MAWRNQAPWPDDNQVEQDLVLSRLIVEFANHELLGPELAFRGGTCLHKLHLPPPLRYSEDLDYVRRTRSGIGPFLDAIRDIARDLGFEDRGVDFAGQMVHTRFDAKPTAGTGLIRVKVEINIAETNSFLPRIALPHRVESPWWTGEAEVETFAIEELLGTKLRALYQRSKGRDLFDLWLALTEASVDDDELVAAFHHYMEGEAFTFAEFAQNLTAKLKDRGFRDDLSQLVIDPPQAYDPGAAANLVMERLGRHLRNAPTGEAIRDGAWRAPPS